MKKWTTLQVLVILIVATVTPAMGVTPELWPAIKSPVGLDSDIEKRIDSLLLQMSVEQKVGQTMQAEIQFVKPEEVKKYHLGSILNGGGSFPDKNKHSSPADWVALAVFADLVRSGIVLLADRKGLRSRNAFVGDGIDLGVRPVGRFADRRVRITDPGVAGTAADRCSRDPGVFAVGG